MSNPVKLKPQAETWAIRHTETGEYFVARSGKNAWRNKGAAKNAWANTWHNSFYYSNEDVELACQKAKVEPVNKKEVSSYCPNLTLDFPYFDQQGQWELVELSTKVEDVGKRAKRAEQLLQECIDGKSLSEELEQKVEDFLNE